MTITKVRYWHLFTTTIIFRAASIVLHNSLHGINVQLIYDQIRMVEWIDDSRFNKPNVRACRAITQGNTLLLMDIKQ